MWIAIAVALLLGVGPTDSLRAPFQLPALRDANCTMWETDPMQCTLNVVWDTATPEPSTLAKRANGPVISGGSPVGNGKTVALVFPLVPLKLSNLSLPGTFVLASGAVCFFVGMTTAMASDTTPFKLGMVTLLTDPPLFGPGPLARFEQRLDLARAIVTLTATHLDGREVSVGVYVDAATDTVVANVSSTVPTTFTTTVQSVHPNATFKYDGGFVDWTAEGTEVSGPDRFANLPDNSGRVAISHRNEDWDFPAAFNDTLRQQGLSMLIPELQRSDRWRHRQFGMMLSGVAVDGVALARHNASALRSTTNASAFTVIVSTRSEQTASTAEWLAKLSQQHDVAMALPSGSRSKRHEGWWHQFWSRSHVTVTAANRSAPTAIAAAEAVSKIYAATRFVQAIQTQTWVPIKFNGELFTATLPPETPGSGPSYRQWGANSWWQNTRLPYWSMASVTRAPLLLWVAAVCTVRRTPPTPLFIFEHCLVCAWNIIDGVRCALHVSGGIVQHTRSLHLRRPSNRTP
jgi:hypothetical protein